MLMEKINRQIRYGSLKWIIIPAIALFMTTITNGQSIKKALLSRQEVTDFKKSLNDKLEDTTRIEVLLKLADYHLQKTGDEKSDLDSAGLYIKDAKAINARQTSRKKDGYILLNEASLARKSGNPDTGKQLIDKAISLLLTAKDEFHLALAYLELSRYYDTQKPDEAAVVINLF